MAPLAAFRELAAALAEERDLDKIFRLIVDTLSELTGAHRCSLHLLNRETGLFHGQAVRANRDIELLVKQLVSGMPGDNFTKEILETRRPVMLTNTLTDPRPVHVAMRRWRVRSVLGVPMVLRGDVIGILCLDTEDTTMAFSEFDQELAISFAELGATAINQVQLTSQLRDSLKTQTKQLELLQRARRMEGQLTDIVLRGSGVRGLGGAIAQQLSKPCAIYDVSFRCLTCSGLPEGLSMKLRTMSEIRHHPLVEAAMESLQPGGVEYIPPLQQHGISHRLLLASIDLSGKRHGYIVVAETAGRFSPLDEVIVRRAAHNIALDRSRSRLENDLEWHAIEAFTGCLIRGEQQDLISRARSLGVRLDVPRVVCVLGARDAANSVQLTPHQAARELTDKESPSAVLGAWSGSDIALILEVPPHRHSRDALTWVKRRITRGLTALSPDGQLCCAISTLVARPDYDHRAHYEAQQVLKCMREHLSDAAPGVLAVDDLGVARLFLASAEHEEAQRFARDTLGELLSDRTAKSAELLTTLEAYLRLARNVRDCADELGVHPNTVRYRLSSIERQLQLFVTTDDADYMTAQIAMTIVRIAGLFGTGSATSDAGSWATSTGSSLPVDTAVG